MTVRLAGWKQIADALEVSERTCRRWAKSWTDVSIPSELRMPVFRMLDGDRSMTYADRDDLLAWFDRARQKGFMSIASAITVPFVERQ